jgi:serine/threonine-protein kinase
MKSPVRWKELSVLFDEFIELEPSARAIRMASLRQDDPPLAEELACVLLIATQGRQREFLAHPPRLDDLVAPRMQAWWIGPDAVEAELAHGGSGPRRKTRHADGRFDRTPSSARAGATRWRLVVLVRRHKVMAFASALLVAAIAAGLLGA